MCVRGGDFVLIVVHSSGRGGAIDTKRPVPLSDLKSKVPQVPDTKVFHTLTPSLPWNPIWVSESECTQSG